ncbi:MAG TPA: glycosyltransferase family 9 protein [Longimicrobiaceae bacterium]|nr:glycosyltransferase family 9 protein [Longimicrobiaceae bacterium]
MPGSLRYPGNRVCVVLLTGLGDVVNGLPLVNALKDHDPSLHVTWVVEPMPAPVLRPHPSVDEVVVYRKALGLRGIRELARELWRRRYDITLNLNVYTKSVWPTFLSRAPHRVGFDRARTFEGVWLAANHHLDPRPRGHTLGMFLEFAEHLGIPVGEPEWRLAITGEERREQAEFFAGMDRPVATVVPATANHRKDWLPDRWARVVDALERDFGFRVVLLGGRGERETRIVREIMERTRSRPLPAMGGPIRRIIWMLEGSALVVAPDTGPLHVARALDVPVVGLYGHTNPWRTGPYRKYRDLWVDRYTDPGAAPDPSDFTPRRGRMEQITVADVLDRVARAVEHYGAGRGAPRA